MRTRTPQVLETEAKYVRDLQTLVHDYFEPLLQLSKVAHAGSMVH